MQFFPLFPDFFLRYNSKTPSKNLPAYSVKANNRNWSCCGNIYCGRKTVHRCLYATRCTHRIQEFIPRQSTIHARAANPRPRSLFPIVYALVLLMHFGTFLFCTAFPRPQTGRLCNETSHERHIVCFFFHCQTERKHSCKPVRTRFFARESIFYKFLPTKPKTPFGVDLFASVSFTLPQPVTRPEQIGAFCGFRTPGSRLNVWACMILRFLLGFLTKSAMLHINRITFLSNFYKQNLFSMT